MTHRSFTPFDWTPAGSSPERTDTLPAQPYPEPRAEGRAETSTSAPPPDEATVLAVAGDAVAVVNDVVSGVRGPVLTGHALTLLVDAPVVVGLVLAWVDLPPAIATILSVGAALVAAASRAYASAQTVAKARAHQATVTAPLAAVVVGRHERP